MRSIKLTCRSLPMVGISLLLRLEDEHQPRTGTHASTLHYVENQSPFGQLPQGSLLLVDAGCEVSNYCADITSAFSRWSHNPS